MKGMMVKLVIFIACLVVGLFLAHRSIDQPQFQITNIKTLSGKPIFRSQVIPQPSFLQFSHSATITALPNGGLLAFWFGGSREGSPDVKIWQSEFTSHGWSLARPILSNYSLMHDLGAYVSKLGNPVVYLARDCVLHLFVVSVSIGGWGGASINHLKSLDYGVTWGKAEKLITSPFINISTLARSTPIELSDGGFYLPVYHEFIRTYPEILRFNARGEFIEQRKISSFNSLLQPTLVAVTASTAYAYMRNNGRINRKLYRLETHDGGIHWGNLIATNLNSYDSSLAVNRIESGALMMAYNVKARSTLVIAISHDGLNWQPQKIIESYTGSDYAEFSYPTVINHDGMINLVYTWYIKGSPHVIKYAQFNKEWLFESVVP